MPMPPDSMYNNSNSMDMVMHMSFFWGKDVIILFQEWPGQRLAMYILALIFVCFLAFATEILSISPPFKPGTSPLMGSLLYAGVYALRMAIAYMVMLSVMSFNLGIFVVALVGHAFGRFLVKYRSFAVASPPSPKV